MKKSEKTIFMLVVFTALLVLFLTTGFGCVPKQYTCPNITTIDCMPIVPENMTKYCAPEYRDWIKENCPNVTFTY